MQEKRVYMAAIVLCGIWMAGILLAPLLASIGASAASDGLYGVYARTCHQLPERSLFVFGRQMAVCSRCFGIYFGSFAGAVSAPVLFLKKKARPPGLRIVLVALLPLAIDGVTQLLGLRTSTNMLRLATGAVFGCVFTVYLLPLVAAREARA